MLNWNISLSARKVDYYIKVVRFYLFCEHNKVQKRFEKSPWAEKIRNNPDLYLFFR
jgi:hypothetical protein